MKSLASFCQHNTSLERLPSSYAMYLVLSSKLTTMPIIKVQHKYNFDSYEQTNERVFANSRNDSPLKSRFLPSVIPEADNNAGSFTSSRTRRGLEASRCSASDDDAITSSPGVEPGRHDGRVGRSGSRSNDERFGPRFRWRLVSSGADDNLFNVNILSVLIWERLK